MIILSISWILFGNGNPVIFAEVEVIGLFNLEIILRQNLFLGILTAMESPDNFVDFIFLKI